MKIAVLSDIHSNIEALTAAFKAIEEYALDEIYCLGDIVGYGPDPVECLDLIRERCTAVVRGNHDTAVANGDGLKVLPKDGREAARHNRALLSEEDRNFLSNLPLKVTAHGCTFVHATPDDPLAWKRLDSYRVAKEQFKAFDTDICFTGHTHIPAVMADKLGVLNVRPGHRFLINTGSVGQPRDGNPRLSLSLFDTETFAYELLRAPYNVDRTAEKIREAGLPEDLALRLKEGR